MRVLSICNAYSGFLGKTIFLYYALLMALQRLKSTVLFAIAYDQITLFEPDSVRHINHNLIPYPDLCLVDTSANLNLIKTAASPKPVILSSSPRKEHFKMFAKQQMAEFWIMALWSEAEMAALA